MKLVFWTSVALIIYANFGYALYLWFRAKVNRKPIAHAAIFPSVSIVMAVRNEEVNLPIKLNNLRQIDYPKDKLQIIVASDGSKDRSAEILQAEGNWIVPVILEESHGKANALNAAVRKATGEILFFQDARQTTDPKALAELVSCFADPHVGAASGELWIEPAENAKADAVGLYWRVEKAIRKLESQTGSVIGATGAIYAVRRNLYAEIPKGTILDDVYVPMAVARQGKRVVFQPSAIARDQAFSQKGKEFKRKVRTLTGNYQLLRLAPWIMSPANPLLFRYVSHKLLRLMVPVLLIISMVSSGLCTDLAYRAMFWSQIFFYALALSGALNPHTKKFKPVAIANTFLVLNSAAVAAIYNFLSGKKNVWT